MPKEFPRSRRVGEQIQRELAELIRDEVRDPRVGMVTITSVEVSKDIAHAKVYVTVLGDQLQTEESLAALGRAAGFLRREVGRRMSLRSVPSLHFVYDESVSRGAHLSTLIDEALAADRAKRGDEDEESQEE